MRAEVLHNPFSGVPGKGEKSRSGYVTPNFSWAHMRLEVLRNPCVLRGPHQRGRNKKWLHINQAPEWAEVLHDP